MEVLQAAKANWSGAVPLALVEKLFTLNEKQGVAFQIAARRMLLGAGCWLVQKRPELRSCTPSPSR